MMKKQIAIWLILVTLLISSMHKAVADELQQQAQALTTSLEQALRGVKSGASNDKKAIRTVIEQVVLPNVDARYFAFKVLGKHLSKMTDEQKEQFTALLQTSMVNNYIAVLKHYNNEALSLETVKRSESGKTGKSLIRVSTTNNDATKDKKITLSWRFKEDKNLWLVYDLEAEGISLLQSKQKEIASVINKQGIDNMLNVLASKVNEATTTPER